jgi:hypothetical protein
MHEKVKYSPTDLHSLMRKKLEISQTGSPNLLGCSRHRKPASRRMVEIRPRRVKKKQIGSGATGQLTRLPESSMLEIFILARNRITSTTQKPPPSHFRRYRWRTCGSLSQA